MAMSRGCTFCAQLARPVGDPRVLHGIGMRLIILLIEFSAMMESMNKKPAQVQEKQMETTIDKKEVKEE